MKTRLEATTSTVQITTMNIFIEIWMFICCFVDNLYRILTFSNLSRTNTRKLIVVKFDGTAKRIGWNGRNFVNDRFPLKMSRNSFDCVNGMKTIQWK